MKKFIKSYYPILFTSMYFFALVFSMAAAIVEPSNNSTNGLFFLGFILATTLISVIALFVMMISYMIHAAKNFRGSDVAIWIILVWFLNVFILPYYNFKFIQKRNDTKTIIASYILCTIASIVFAIVFIKQYL